MKVTNGDKVCIFFCAEHPYIVHRSVGSDHGETIETLVGRTYVHGIMDGEAFALSADEVEETAFALS